MKAPPESILSRLKGAVLTTARCLCGDDEETGDKLAIALWSVDALKRANGTQHRDSDADDRIFEKVAEEFGIRASELKYWYGQLRQEPDSKPR